MASLPKNWVIETLDGRYVVRATQAGMLLSDATNSPTLYDHQTAKKVAEELAGMLGLNGIIVRLQAKPRNPDAHPG